MTALLATVTVLLIPGSGFSGIGPHETPRLAVGVQHWRDWGFRTRVVRYRAGRRGLADVRRAVARTTNPSRTCLYGESSGGTWALIAAADAGVACVIASASPTDQETWAQSDAHGAQVLSTERWPRYFGRSPDEDDDYEPYDVWSAFEPEVPALLVYAANDLTVPPQQGRWFATVPGDVTLRVLPRGHAAFVHSKVGRSALIAARTAMRRFVVQTTRP